MMPMKAWPNIINNWLTITDCRDPYWKAFRQNDNYMWVLKAALVSNDLSKHKESKAFFNKQNTMLKVVLKTYLVKFFD